MQLRELIADAANDTPTVHGERCVHSRAEVASCDLCVSSCPQDAWQLDDDALYIDGSLCDGCGLCAAHCPEAALLQPGVRLAENASGFASAACARASQRDHQTLIPCINAIGLSQLTAAWQRGLRRLHLSVGDCVHCSRRDDDAFMQRVKSLNSVLHARRLPALDVRLHAGDDASGDRSGDGLKPLPAGVSRRDFFGRIFRTLAETASDPAQIGSRPPGQFLPPTQRGDAVLLNPRIDVSRCNGCDACARICPHGALTVTAEGYRIDASACTGCRLCSDVCDQEAVSILPNAAAEAIQIPLHLYRCAACAATFHTPREQTSERPLCRVCRQVNHSRMLFQVLE